MAKHEFENGAGPSGSSWTAVRRDLEELRADVVKLGETSLSEGQEKLAEEAQRLKGLLTDLIRGAEQQGRVSLDGVAGYVTQRPVSSVAIAFSSGLLLAMLFGGRRQ